jgi:hypothetical protein
MTNEQLPFHLPHYCMLCGARLIYTEINIVAGEGKASWRCSGCGKEETDNWSEIDFSLDDQADQSLPDTQFTSLISDFMLTPPPPPSSYFDDPEDSPMNQEEFVRAFQEHQMQYITLHQQLEPEGVAGIIRAAHFPLFALNDLRGRFPFKSYGWGSGGSKAESAGLVSSFSLKYAGPDYPNVTERIIIEQEDRESYPRLRRTTDESGTFDERRIVRILADLPESEWPDMQALSEGKAIYRYVNIETVRRAPVVHASIKLQSGEAASWAIKRFNAPLPIAYACTQIDDTMIDIGMIGPAAEEIESLLGQLARLTPESVALDQLNLGLKAWDEYLQRRFQS